MDRHSIKKQPIKCQWVFDNKPDGQKKAHLSQIATYWFVIGSFDNQSVQKSKVRQVAKDVVKSEVYPQT